jgi:hypothetical protein
MRDCVDAESVEVQYAPTMSLEVVDDLLRMVPFRADAG